MTFPVTIEQDEAGFFVVECPSLPGCFSQGRTREEGLASIRRAIRLSLETRLVHDLAPQLEVAEVDVQVP